MHSITSLRRKYNRLKNRLSRIGFQKLSRKKQEQLRRRLGRCEQRVYQFAGIAILGISSATTLRAQIGCLDIQSDENNPFEEINVGGFAHPQMVDVNDDNYLDLITGNIKGEILYFQNDGSNNYIQQTGMNNPFDHVKVAGQSSPQLVDVDMDGDLDLISGVGASFTDPSGTIVYFQNDGDNHFFEKIDSENPFNGIDVGSYSAPHLADVNDDGYLDLIIGNFFGTISYYQNDGSGNYLEQLEENNPFSHIDVSAVSVPKIVDVDGDSNLDLVVGEFFDSSVGTVFGTIRYFRNDGSGNYVSQDIENNSLNVNVFGAAPQLIDLDQDDDLDLIVGNGAGEIVYFQNIPTCLTSDIDGYTECNSDAFDDLRVGYVSSPQLIDFDDDGDLDLISGNTSGSIFYYKNDGNDNFIEQLDSDNPFNNIDVGNNSSPQLIDFDDDGDLDLISGSYNEYSTNNIIQYYKNDNGIFNAQLGDSNPFNSINVGYFSAPHLVDFDNDGDIDLVSGEQYGRILYYQNDSNNSFIEQVGSDNPFNEIDNGHFSNLQLVDFDNDGDLDLIMGGGGSISYYKNTENSVFALQVDTDNPFDAVNPSANFPNLIDFDSDGDLDLICGEQYGRFFYYKNTNLSVSNSMQTCVGGEAVVKLKVVSNEEKGIYTITNAFTGSIGSEGVLGAAEKLTPDITILGTYVLEVTANDGCAQVAAVVEVDDIIPTVVDIQSIDINTCTNPFTASFNPVENAIAYQVELTLPALNNRIITKKIIETNLETNIRLPRRLVGKEILVRIAPIFEEDGIEEICDYSEQRSFVIGCDEENAITLEERSKEAQLSDFIDEQSVLSIFPIPASNQLYYQVDQMEDVRAIYLFDVHGRIVQEEKVLDGVMDISHLPNGKYTLVLESAQRRVHRLVQKF